MNKQLDFNLKLKGEVSEQGIFEGYASVFDVVDFDNDVLVKGAFTETISWFKSQGRKIPMLWAHSTHNPIGVWEEAAEDTTGLRVVGRLLLDVQEAREKYSLIKEKSISGLSIGFRAIEQTYDRVSGINYIKKARLREISLVTFPANDAARVLAVKNDGTLPSEREFERLLRDAGYSKTQANTIISKGYRGLHGERVAGNELAELKQALTNLQNTVKGHTQA